jgi:hypothetical protein
LYFCVPLDFFLALVGAEEDELARRRLDAGRVEHLLQRQAGPAAVAAQALNRCAVAGALEARHELGAAHLLQIVERQLQRLVDQARHLQPERRRIDLRMAVVLRRRPLVDRRERAVDRADVQHAPVWRPLEAHVVRQIREGHHRFTLRKGGQDPLGHPDEAQAGRHQTLSQNVSTCRLVLHARMVAPDEFP